MVESDNTGWATQLGGYCSMRWATRASASAPGRGADHDAVAARLVGRLHDQGVEMPEHELTVVGVATPPRGHVGEDGLLAEEVPDDLGHEGVDGLVVGDAGAGRAHHGHVPAPPGAHEPGHTRRSESRRNTSGSRNSSSIRR